MFFNIIYNSDVNSLTQQSRTETRIKKKISIKINQAQPAIKADHKIIKKTQRTFAHYGRLNIIIRKKEKTERKQKQEYIT